MSLGVKQQERAAAVEVAARALTPRPAPPFATGVTPRAPEAEQIEALAEFILTGKRQYVAPVDLLRADASTSGELAKADG